MMRLCAVAPYDHHTGLDFKTQVFTAWKNAGGGFANGFYLPKLLHGLAYKYELPTIWKSNKEARLRFVEALSIKFDTFPDYAHYEVVPMIWDCWPKYFDETCKWLEKHHVRTAIFTASKTAERMHNRFPQMNILTITEGIDTSRYGGGLALTDRPYNLMEIGKKCRNFFSRLKPEDYRKLCNSPYLNKFIPQSEFSRLLGESKVTVVLPKCVTEKYIAGDVETLTQRYWECMLSRMVMVGIAPQELIDLIGYNPVIPIDYENATEQVWNIIEHISEYQDMVDENRRVALKYAPWSIRIEQIRDFLQECHYKLK